MSEADARHYLEATLESMPCSTGRAQHEVFPLHQALVAFELIKSQLALASTPCNATRLDNSELAHAPVMLSPLAWPKAYDYAVHRRSNESRTRGPNPTWLLIYRGENKTVKYLELQETTYTLLQALKLASVDQCPLVATELLLELAEYHDTDNVVLFVEQGLKLLSRLNELGLV